MKSYARAPYRAKESPVAGEGAEDAGEGRGRRPVRTALSSAPVMVAGGHSS
jgi:hypothetical protein